ncbi:TPA: hypothetical protein R8G39_000047 [Citrobacter freundii]|uniref:hypothetical protein n=1 Tax=Citrobacter freundii TaxID=546 RepID=UPI0023B26EE3|nr:hypothetical protein [Citrobacter freundii]MDE9642491.1 hypothetical protein [Citrobacter freundii]MDE9696796.1 hypothetical protein [Citrobacter freundii]HEE9942560.1 hypothetical protein [Citrobacter freundii]
MSGGLSINIAEIKSTVSFVVDRNSMKTALDAFDQIQKKAKGIKDPTINMKRFSQGLKSAERELDKLNKKASKPRSNDEREKARAAKAQARVEAQAAKEAQRTAVRRERAELKLLDTASSFKSMQHLTNVELTQAALAASRITKAYAAGTISLQRQTSELKRLQQSYRRINAERRAAAKAGGANALAGGGKATGAISGSLMGLGTGALAGAGIGAAAYGAYSWGKDAVTAQEERSEIVARAKLGGVDYNVLQALSQYATANGIDSGIGTQGARKNLDVAKDVSEKLADGALNAKRNKQGEWTGAPTGINTALNMGYTPEQLKEWAKNPFGFVSSYTNTMQSKGLSEQEILHNLEDLGDDLGLYAKAFMNGGKALTDQVDVLKRNGQWLDEAQQDQLVAYRKFNQEMDILNDSQKLAFFEGFMESLDPATVKEFKEAMQEALPFFEGVGRAAGDAAVGLLKLSNWITGRLNLLNGDNTTKEAVSQHYGTTSAPALPGSNPVANAYGASQPKADGTHEHNVFDTMREWWNGTSNAKDVSSYAQSTNGDYSPVSMLKQSAAATATPPAKNTVVQPVVLQNNLPEGMISLTISPDPTFGKMLNASVDQRINQNNQRMVLAVSSGQSSTGG